MKRKQFLKLGSLSIASWITTGYSQQQSQLVSHLFDSAARQHKQELRALRSSRAAPIIYLPDVSSESIANVLSVYEGHGRYEQTYPEGTSVLFYAHDREILQSWLLDQDGIQAYHRQIISNLQISEKISLFRKSLDIVDFQRSRSPRRRGGLEVSFSSEHEQSLESAISELTELLLPDVVADKLDNTRHLIVVPTLDIGTVPYAVLKPFDSDERLVDKMSVSIAPSLFDLGQTLPPFSPYRLFSRPLIVGDPYLPDSSRWSVPSLPGAMQEARVVAEIINASLEHVSAIPLTGIEARKEDIVSRLRESSLLYFATHGVSSNPDPLNGGFLMLSADVLEQGWLTAQEIQRMECYADMAILSACQTGLGQAHDAGIIGLARAFQLAGVPRVVMSLWNVDDLATSGLMQAFIRHIEANIPAEALRLAMLETREKYPHPSRWASFTIFGTPR